MKVNVKITKLSPLTKAELAEINGGSMETGNASMTMSSSVDSLLSMEFHWQQGDQSRDWKISAGNNIDLNLNAYNKGANLA